MSKMIVYVLFGKNKDSYPGEYGPETFDAVDQFSDEENPEYRQNKLKGVLSATDGRLESLKWIPIKLDMDEILSILKPEPEPIEGKIKE